MQTTVINKIKISVEDNPYRLILKGVADLWDRAFDNEEDGVLLIVTESLEKVLKEKSRLPIRPDLGTVIIDGKCAGYKYLKVPDDIGEEVFGLNSENLGLIFYRCQC